MEVEVDLCIWVAQNKGVMIAIVASGIPVAVGVAEAQKRLNQIDNKNRIVICQFGDGLWKREFL